MRKLGAGNVTTWDKLAYKKKKSIKRIHVLMKPRDVGDSDNSLFLLETYIHCSLCDAVLMCRQSVRARENREKTGTNPSRHVMGPQGAVG